MKQDDPYADDQGYGLRTGKTTTSKDATVLHEVVIPRRIRIDQFVPAERAIYDAVQAVEAAGAHPHLTNAVILLGQAREKVADFVDGTAVATIPLTPPEEMFAGMLTFSEVDRELLLRRILAVTEESRTSGAPIGGWFSVTRWAVAALTYEATLRAMEQQRDAMVRLARFGARMVVEAEGQKIGGVVEMGDVREWMDDAGLLDDDTVSLDVVEAIKDLLPHEGGDDRDE